MTMTKADAQALANYVQRIRPDWDYPGLMAAIQHAHTLGSVADVSIALLRIADDPQVRTPGVLKEPGPHWQGTNVAARKAPVRCPDHDTKLVAGSCPDCQAAMSTGRPENFRQMFEAARDEHRDDVERERADNQADAQAAFEAEAGEPV